MAKNITNQEGGGFGSGSSGPASDYITLTAEIKFPSAMTEGFNTDYVVRDSPILPAGTLAQIKFTKVANVVHMTIPSFHGSMLVGNATSIMRIVTVGDLPDRFLPRFRTNWPIDAYNNGGLINVNQDHADLVVNADGNIDLISRSFLWNGNSGLFYDLTASWHV